MFFKKRSKDSDDVVETTAALEGTMPELAEIDLPADGDAETGADLATSLDASQAPAVADAVRLFPGFEREDFEVGFGAAGAPALLMRWKDGGDWFRMPAMFNRAVLAAMDERDSAGDLNRLLRSFGYEVGAEEA